MAVANPGLPSEFSHQFLVTEPAPSLLEEISRRASVSDPFPESCILESAYGISNALTVLQELAICPHSINCHSLVWHEDFIKLTLANATQVERFKSPLERKKNKCISLSHNQYKSIVFSLGIALLEAAQLRETPDFNVPGCLSSNFYPELYETVMNLDYQKPVKCLLLVCLKHDEATRPDCKELFQMLECRGFELMNYLPVNETFLLNERTYAAPVSEPEPDEGGEVLVDHLSLGIENPPIEEVSVLSVEEPSMVTYVPLVLPTRKVVVVTKLLKKY